MTKEEALLKYFGYSYFKEEQIQIIDSILQGNDTVGILPTGYGKSVTFQIPSILLEGLTLVITPLISLMNDQVIHLKEKKLAAEYINSLQSKEEQEVVFFKLAHNKVKLLYVAAERLLNKLFLNEIRKQKIALLVCDEAHTLLWSEDFRLALGKIPDFFIEIGYRPPVLALTATATSLTIHKIKDFLKLNNPLIVRGSVIRNNIFYRVIQTRNKEKYLLKYLATHNKEKGLIYCQTVKETEYLYQHLQLEGYSIGLYHGRLEPNIKKHMQSAYADNLLSLLVCTNAFGMGIDLPNIRYVVEYSLPSSIEELCQQTGRASRDGKKAEALIFFASKDISTIEFFINNINKEDKTFKELRTIKKERKYKLNKIIQFCTSKRCLQYEIANYFNEKHIGKCQMCCNCKKK